ncbi:hypothetical protein Mapa_014124 [Marchantia paleacea]|nr:hypothetical protein Mapa_014124 [Marchantia paleacea]
MVDCYVGNLDLEGRSTVVIIRASAIKQSHVRDGILSTCEWKRFEDIWQKAWKSDLHWWGTQRFLSFPMCHRSKV